MAAGAGDGVLHHHLHGPHHHGRRPPLHGRQLPQGARRQEQGRPREGQEEDQGAQEPQRQGEEGAQEGREAGQQEEVVDDGGTCVASMYHGRKESVSLPKLLLTRKAAPMLYSVIQADGSTTSMISFL